MTLDEPLYVWGAWHGFCHPHRLHALPDVDFGRRVLADGHRPHESVRVGHETLLKVHRPVVEIHQLGHNLEFKEEIFVISSVR